MSPKGLHRIFFFVRTRKKARLSEAIAFTVAVFTVGIILWEGMSRIQGHRATIFLTRVIAGCQNPALKSIRLEEPCSKHCQFCNGKFGSRSRLLKGALAGWELAGIINMESGAPLNVVLGGPQGSNGVQNGTNRPDLTGKISYPKRRITEFAEGLTNPAGRFSYPLRFAYRLRLAALRACDLKDFRVQPEDRYRSGSTREKASHCCLLGSQLRAVGLYFDCDFRPSWKSLCGMHRRAHVRGTGIVPRGCVAAVSGPGPTKTRSRSVSSWHGYFFLLRQSSFRKRVVPLHKSESS